MIAITLPHLRSKDAIEPHIVYAQLDNSDGKTFSRPVSDFLAYIDRGNRDLHCRFTFIRDF